MRIKNLGLSLIAVLGIICVPAYAAKYDFSYTFADGSVVSGTLDGIANGSNLLQNFGPWEKINFNGNPVDITTNPPSNYKFSNVTGFNPGRGNVSFNGLENNFRVESFWFGNNDPRSFQFASYDSGNAGNPFRTITFYQPSSVMEYENFDSSRWALVASVPEPETYAMLLAGLGLIGAAVKRRKSN
jgi:hypothetical protein